MAMATNKKKIIILCTMVALLVASGYLNWALGNKPQAPITGDTAVTSYFNSAKSDRDAGRNAQIAYFDAIISPTSGVTQERKLEAEAAKIQLIREIEIELDVETFLFGKAYQASIVSCTENSINVTVYDPELNAQKVSQI